MSTVRYISVTWSLRSVIREENVTVVLQYPSHVPCSTELKSSGFQFKVYKLIYSSPLDINFEKSFYKTCYVREIWIFVWYTLFT